jgi:CubicO group peptidase (beta-lactamase class C family)
VHFSKRLLLSFLYPISVLIGKKKTSLDMQEFENFVARAMATYHVPGASVALIKNGKIAYAQGFGYRDIEHQSPATPETIFAIGSCTKSFTATALGKLVDMDKLDWDSPLKAYLPGFEMYDRETTERITIRDCLCHRSGLPAYGGDGCLWTSFENKAALAAHLRTIKPTAKFREKWQYSNTMYAFAGYVLESLSGMPWDVFVQKYVTEPCGMHNTFFSVSDIPATANASLAYEFNKVSHDFKPVAYEKNVYRWVAPAGSMHSNVLDMTQWIIANLQNKAINAEVHKPHISFDDSGIKFHYCLGWVKNSDGTMWHNGGTAGCSALVRFSPEEQTGIVVLSNIADVHAFNGLLAQYAQTCIHNDQAWWGKRWYKKMYVEVVRYACEKYISKDHQL